MRTGRICSGVRLSLRKVIVEILFDRQQMTESGDRTVKNRVIGDRVK
jgi:hypothetical protein